MTSSYDFKPRFQALLRPAMRRLLALGVSPNAVTVAALILSAAMGAALVLWAPQRWVFVLLPAVLLLRMVLNALDGMMAREGGRTTALGAALNEVGDVLADAVLYVPFALALGVPPLLAAGFAVLAACTEMAGLCGAVTGVGRRYDGPFGKSDRAIALGAVALVAALGWMTPLAAALVFAVASALAAATVANRIRHVARGTP